jgi:hypothetical protein
VDNGPSNNLYTSEQSQVAQQRNADGDSKRSTVASRYAARQQAYKEKAERAAERRQAAQQKKDESARKKAERARKEAERASTVASRYAARQQAYKEKADRAAQLLERQSRELMLHYSDEGILRLMRTKPAKIEAIEDIKELLSDIERLLLHVIDSSGYGIKGWNGIRYGMTSSKIARLKLHRDDLKERRDELLEEARQNDLAKSRAQQAAMRFARAGQDTTLASALWHALETTPSTVGYVYLRRWSMPDGSAWYKVGITNDSARREAEQNVLPVAAETIVCVDVGSMDRARAIESVVHQVLKEQQITDANNRELFHLSDQQASAVKAILERLE